MRWPRPENLLGVRRSGCDAVSDVPQVFVEPVLHALLEHFHRRAHGSNHSSADNPLGQFQVMETEDLHTFVEVKQAFSQIVQAEELFVSAINFVYGDAALFHLVIESLAQAWADM